MIIYGWNSKTLKQAPVDNLECPSCNHKSSVIGIVSRYVHIFWIPLFPYKKEAVIVCSNCGFTLREKDLDGDRREKLKQMRKAVKTPVYLFSGLIIIALFAGYISYSSHQSDQLESEYLQSPEIGDVYINYDATEATEYKYYLWKVDSVLQDSLYFSPSSFSYNMIPATLESEDGFYDAYFAIHKEQVVDMYSKGEIKEIKRDYGDYTGFNRIIEYPSIDTVNNTN